MAFFEITFRDLFGIATKSIWIFIKSFQFKCSYFNEAFVQFSKCIDVLLEMLQFNCFSWCLCCCPFVCTFVQLLSIAHITVLLSFWTFNRTSCHLLAHVVLVAVSWFFAHTRIHVAHPNLKKQLYLKNVTLNRIAVNSLVKWNQNEFVIDSFAKIY